MIYRHLPNHYPEKAEITISIRPENTTIPKRFPPEKKNILKGKVKEKTLTGNNIDYRIAVKEEIVRFQEFDTDISHQINEEVYLWIKPHKVTVLSE